MSRFYRVGFGDGYEGIACEDELLTEPSAGIRVRTEPDRAPGEVVDVTARKAA